MRFWGIFTSPLRGSENIHHYSPPPRWIIVKYNFCNRNTEYSPFFHFMYWKLPSNYRYELSCAIFWKMMLLFNLFFFFILKCLLFAEMSEMFTHLLNTGTLPFFTSKKLQGMLIYLLLKFIPCTNCTCKICCWYTLLDISKLTLNTLKRFTWSFLSFLWELGEYFWLRDWPKIF